MKHSHREIPSRFLRGFLPALVGLMLTPVMGTSVLASEIFKADNDLPLNDPASWVGGVVPGPNDVAVWDSTITAVGSVASVDAPMTWRGIRIANPLGPVGIIGLSELRLGAGGIDMSAAQTGFSISAPIGLVGSQRFVVGMGQNLAISGAIARPDTTTGLQLELRDGATITYTGPTWAVNTLISHGNMNYATLNETDFAAVGAGGAIVGGATILPSPPPVPPPLGHGYTPNPSGTALPGLPTVEVRTLDYVNPMNFGARLPGTRTVHNHRFNMPNDSPTGWLFDTATAGRVITSSSILITENVGAQNVRFGGAAFVRIGNTGLGMVVFQNNPHGDLIFDSGQGISEQGAGRTLTKLGEGRMLINTVAAYTGATRVLEGTLLINAPAATTSVYVAPGATFGGTGTIAGAVTVDGRLTPGMSTGVMTFSNALTLGGTVEFDIGGLARGAEYDGINVGLANGLTYGGALFLDFTNPVLVGDYDLFSFTGTAGGSFASVTLGGLHSGSLALSEGVWTGVSGAYTFSFVQAAGDLNVIPEPSTYAMIFGALALVGAIYWRRRRNG